MRKSDVLSAILRKLEIKTNENASKIDALKNEIHEVNKDIKDTGACIPIMKPYITKIQDRARKMNLEIRDIDKRLKGETDRLNRVSYKRITEVAPLKAILR